MVYNYVRKTTKNSWTEAALSQAMHSVRKKNFKIRQAAREFNIPESTLRRHLLTNSEKKERQGQTVFSPEQELEISQHILDMANTHQVFNYADLRRYAYEYAKANNVPNQFSKKSKMAGKDWLRAFFTRNTHIKSSRQSASTLHYMNDEDFDDDISTKRYDRRWDDKTTIKFINLLKGQPILWKSDIKNAATQSKGQEIFKRLSFEMGLTLRIVEAKYRTLTEKFYAEERLQLQQPAYIPTWKFFSYLSFLSEKQLPIKQNVKTKKKSSKSRVVKVKTADFIKVLKDYLTKNENEVGQNLSVRHKIWTVLGNATGVPEKYLVQKFESLRRQYIAEFKRTEKDPNYVSKWKFYNALMFLSVMPGMLEDELDTSVETPLGRKESDGLDHLGLSSFISFEAYNGLMDSILTNDKTNEVKIESGVDNDSFEATDVNMVNTPTEEIQNDVQANVKIETPAAQQQHADLINLSYGQQGTLVPNVNMFGTPNEELQNDVQTNVKTEISAQLNNLSYGQQGTGEQNEEAYVAKETSSNFLLHDLFESTDEHVPKNISVENEWTEKQMVDFIKALKEYLTKNEANEAMWTALSEAIGKPGADLQNRFRNLKTQYFYLLNKVHEYPSFVPQWKYFNMLTFLSEKPVAQENGLNTSGEKPLILNECDGLKQTELSSFVCFDDIVKIESCNDSESFEANDSNMVNTINKENEKDASIDVETETSRPYPYMIVGVTHKQQSHRVEGGFSAFEEYVFSENIKTFVDDLLESTEKPIDKIVSTQVEWNDKEIMYFLRALRNYQRKYKAGTNLRARNVMWAALSQAIGRPQQDLQSKLRNLRTSYNHILQKMNENPYYMTNWKYFNKLKLLLKEPAMVVNKAKFVK